MCVLLCECDEIEMNIFVDSASLSLFWKLQLIKVDEALRPLKWNELDDWSSSWNLIAEKCVRKSFKASRKLVPASITRSEDVFEPSEKSIDEKNRTVSS